MRFHMMRQVTKCRTDLSFHDTDVDLIQHAVAVVKMINIQRVYHSLLSKTTSPSCRLTALGQALDDAQCLYTSIVLTSQFFLRAKTMQYLRLD